MTESEKPKATTEADQSNILRHINPNAHAGVAINSSALVERCVSASLEAEMPNLSNRLRGSLFGGYGPLATFSAKIDISFALGLYPHDIRRSLHAVRGVRNAFAHSTEMTHFDHPNVVEKLKNFQDFKNPESNVVFFHEKCLECADKILKAMEKKSEITRVTGDAINHYKEHISSLEKSE